MTYVFEGNIRSSGDTLRWVGEDLGLFGDFPEAERLAASVPGSGGVYLVPAFSGMGAPHWVQGARTSITGLSRGTGRAHVVRAAVESVAYQVRDVIAAMGAGGVALRDLRVASVADVSARGAAFMAGLASGTREGLWGNEAELGALARPAAEYLPAMGDTDRGELIAGWEAALARTFHGL